MARPIDDGAADGEDLHQLGDGVLAGGVHADQLRLLAGGQLGLLVTQLALGAAMAMPSRVRIFSRSTSNSAKVARMLKNILPIGVGRVVQGAAEGQPDAAGDQGAADVAGVGRGAGEPVEFGDDQGVADAYLGAGNNWTP